MRTHLRDRTFPAADPVAKWQGCRTMSQLKLFRPPDDATHGNLDESPPRIYSISAFRIPARGGNQQSTAARARVKSGTDIAHFELDDKMVGENDVHGNNEEHEHEPLP